jgi:hypothetical protein
VNRHLIAMVTWPIDKPEDLEEIRATMAALGAETQLLTFEGDKLVEVDGVPRPSKVDPVVDDVVATLSRLHAEIAACPDGSGGSDF